jgi:hypothetical protein
MTKKAATRLPFSLWGRPRLSEAGACPLCSGAASAIKTAGAVFFCGHAGQGSGTLGPGFRARPPAAVATGAGMRHAGVQRQRSGAGGAGAAGSCRRPTGARPAPGRCGSCPHRSPRTCSRPSSRRCGAVRGAASPSESRPGSRTLLRGASLPGSARSTSSMGVTPSISQECASRRTICCSSSSGSPGRP